MRITKTVLVLVGTFALTLTATAQYNNVYGPSPLNQLVQQQAMADALAQQQAAQAQYDRMMDQINQQRMMQQMQQQQQIQQQMQMNQNRWQTPAPVYAVPSLPTYTLSH